MSTPREKFQGLLRELFQFDCAELDFGIYRIMNQKRAVIERFIEKDLLDGVATELSSGALAMESGLAQQLEEVKAKIRENFGEDAMDAEGNLVKYADSPRGQQYLELREQVGKAKSRPELESAIFNHLYSFFSRYYDEGDFMSLRRYSKRAPVQPATAGKNLSPSSGHRFFVDKPASQRPASLKIQRLIFAAGLRR